MRRCKGEEKEVGEERGRRGERGRPQMTWEARELTGAPSGVCVCVGG